MSAEAAIRASATLGGRVAPDPDHRPRTGNWRTGIRPAIELDHCVHCLLCWAYCPDCAIETQSSLVTGIDLNLCKGCEICAAVCPMKAIVMVPDILEGLLPLPPNEESR